MSVGEGVGYSVLHVDLLPEVQNRFYGISAIGFSSPEFRQCRNYGRISKSFEIILEFRQRCRISKTVEILTELQQQ